MPPKQPNKKAVYIFVAVFIVVLAVLAIFIGLRLSSQFNTTKIPTVDNASTTKIGGNIYCAAPDGSKVMPLNTGTITVTDNGTYPTGGVKEPDVTVSPDESGNWSADVNWSNTLARYSVSYSLGNTYTVLANGVKFTDLQSKTAVNCSTPSKIGSSDIANSSDLNLKSACLNSGNLCVSDTDKTTYNSCQLNGAATDKKNGYKGFDFAYQGCGNPISTDVQLKLITNSVFVPGGNIELFATVKNNSADKMSLSFGSPVILDYQDIANDLDNISISCTSTDGISDCGVKSVTDNVEYLMNSLDAGANYTVILTGKLKTTYKLQDKISINVEAKVAPGYVDTNYSDNRATIEKTIIVDGKQCSDSKLAWDNTTCWGNVKLSDTGTYYFDCPTGEACDVSLRALTESQLCMYLNWVNASKPNIPNCAVTTVNLISSSTSTVVSLPSSLSSSSVVSSSVATITPVASSSISSSSMVSSSSIASSSSSSSRVSSASSSSASLPRTAVEPVQIFAWLSILLILFGFVSYKFFFREVNYEKVEDLRFELSKQSYLKKQSIREAIETNTRKVKWEISYRKNKLIFSIKKLFDKKP